MATSSPILLLEDDLVDAMTVRRALGALQVHNPLVHVEDGEQGLEYLRDAANRRPCLMLVDLNMPRMNGLEFLSALKQERTPGRSGPAIVLTTSDHHDDRTTSLGLGAADYVLKPLGYERFVDLLCNLCRQWSLRQAPCASGC